MFFIDIALMFINCIIYPAMFLIMLTRNSRTIYDRLEDG